MIVLVGHSGTGKSVTERALEILGYKRVISYTSRKPREGEIDGFHYHFIIREAMEDLSKKGFFAEYTEYKGNLYGMALGDCKQGRILVAEPDGMRQLLARKDIDLFPVFLKSSEKTRAIRMLERGDSIDDVYSRIVFDRDYFKDLDTLIPTVIKTEKNTPCGVAREIIHYYVQRHTRFKIRYEEDLP